MASADPLLAMMDALYGVLALDDALLALAPGGVHSDVPDVTTAFPFPFVWLELRKDRELGGFGTQPGRRSVPGVHLRVHVFQSDYGTTRDAQLVMARIVDLLWNDGAALAAEGYVVYGGKPLPDAEEILLADQELRGVKVKELVLLTDYVIEEAA